MPQQRRRHTDFNDDDYNYNHNSSHPTRSGRYETDDDEDYYMDEYRRESRREQHKSRVGEALADLEIGNRRQAVGTSTRHSRTRSRDHGLLDRYRCSSAPTTSRRSRSSGYDHSRHSRWVQATEAAFIAGAIEAFRICKKPGQWTGEKGIRVATAALGAAGVDVLIDKDPHRKVAQHIAEATIAGLAANRIANGSGCLSQS